MSYLIGQSKATLSVYLRMFYSTYYCTECREAVYRICFPSPVFGLANLYVDSNFLANSPELAEGA